MIDAFEFLETIFDEVPPREAVLIAKQTKRGFYHVTADDPKLARWLRKGKSAVYFNISTVADEARDEDEQLRRRSDDCRAVYCFVLDDVGEKVDEPDVQPSWILETSPGSFQWGYLITPTEDLDKFAAFMDAMVEAGHTDPGAKGFNRLMRIPGSRNTKPGRDLFESRIVEWNPEEVFDTLEDAAAAFGVQIGAVTARDRKQKIKLDNVKLDVQDPLVDWMNDRGMVVADDGEWLTIECPNCDAHTTGDDYARYSPLGRGTDGFEMTRGFHCFHAHCKDLNLLEWARSKGAPYLRAYDPLPFLQQRYVYVASGRRMCDLHGLKAGGRYDFALEEFGDMFADLRVPAPTLERPKRTIAGKAAMMEDPGTIKCVSYQTIPFSPGEPGRGGVEAGKGDQKVVNIYQPPEHTATPQKLDMFLEHIAFLLPDGNDADTFLDWLAYKLQHPRSRSFGVVMVAADTFGIGRSWLGDVIRAVWLPSNVASVDIGDLTGHGQSAGFNDWASGSQFVIIEEAHDGADQTHYRAYERIKTLVDPRISAMQINSKYGAKRQEQIWFNLLVFSNHIDAFNLPKGERRLAVFANPQEQMDEGYYTELWATYNNHGAGLAAAIYEFLMERDVSRFNPAVPPETEAKAAMISNSAAPGDIISTAIIERCKGELVTKELLFDLFEEAERAEHIENTLNQNVRRRLVEKLWQTLPRLRDAKNGLRTRARCNRQEEVRALRRRGYWQEVFEAGADMEILKDELARSAGGIGHTRHDADGIAILHEEGERQ